MSGKIGFIILSLGLSLASQGLFSQQSSAAEIEDMDALRSAACGDGVSSDARKKPWHIANLYNCKNNTFFVP
ncbi:MAG: hypothetical protein ACKVJQ_02355 [Alphaproteobacteria bacterium]|jgi:hypothetical protein